MGAVCAAALAAVGLFCSPAAASASALSETCSPTPQLAVAAAFQPDAAEVRVSRIATVAAHAPSFRVHHTQADPFSRSVWAWVETCGAPERPWIAVRLPPETARGAIAAARPADRQDPPEVRAGEPVDVTAEKDSMTIHVSGKALASGRRGQSIRVLVTLMGRDRIVETQVTGTGTVRVCL